jgi:hypothetical protein
MARVLLGDECEYPSNFKDQAATSAAFGLPRIPPVNQSPLQKLANSLPDTAAEPFSRKV